MRFRAAIEQDALDLRELADRAQQASGSPDLLPALHLEGGDPAKQERALDTAAMTLRRRWLRVTHQSADGMLKSPRAGAVTEMPGGEPMSFGYERELDASLLERRGRDYLDCVPGWTNDVVLFRSGQASLAGLLQFAIQRWGEPGPLTIAHAGRYFETAALLNAWPERILGRCRHDADVVIAEPVWCDGAFSCGDAPPMAHRLLILDTTLVGPGFDVRGFLQQTTCPLVIVYSSGLKLDQAGLELGNVGIVRVYGRGDAPRDAHRVGSALRRIRSLVGTGLTLDEMSALSAPWFMDRPYADRYVGAVFANNRRLAAAIGAQSPIFASHCHPSLDSPNAEAPFCALQLNEPSPSNYRALERRIAQECERRSIVAPKGGSFGFRGHRFQLIEPEPGQGETFLRVALGWRDGWSCRGLCDLFEEIAQGR